MFSAQGLFWWHPESATAGFTESARDGAETLMLRLDDLLCDDFFDLPIGVCWRVGIFFLCGGVLDAWFGFFFS